jgi:transcription-repair coupling factor (superfamily II helicase)
VGAGEAAPKSRGGHKRRAAAKKKASSVLKELASEYIGMYATRRAVMGYAIFEDTAGSRNSKKNSNTSRRPTSLRPAKK